MLFGKKRVITNPDEAIIRFFESNENKYAKAINSADTEMLTKVLLQFDLTSVCRVLAILDKSKAQLILSLFDKDKQEQIIKRMPSNFAAACIEESICK